MRDEERLALAVGIWLGEMCVLSTADYYHLQPEKPFLIIAGIVLTGLVFRGIRAAGPLALAYVVGVGIVDALPSLPSNGSDVLLATKEALATLLGGHNPYLHTYVTTNPRGVDRVRLWKHPRQCLANGLSLICGVMIGVKR